MSKPKPLSPAQRDALDYWWQRQMQPPVGYDPHAISEPKGTLLALERRGLVTFVRPHHTPGNGWKADVTEAGRQAARAAYVARLVARLRSR